MHAQIRKWIIRLASLVVLGVIAIIILLKYSEQDKNAGLVSGNGRIEAVEIDIAAKTPGRVKEILVREGDFVTANQVVAHMDTEVLEAQLHQAEAQLRQAESAVTIARSQVLLKVAERAASLAILSQREAEHDIADKRLVRSSLLAKEGASSQQEADDDSARVTGTAAAVSATRAQVAAADAAIATSRAQVSGAESAVEAAKASIERIRADIADSALQAPRNGRIQYRVAQAGEVVSAGGRVLNMVDLTDVYMTFFLPTTVTGKIALGSEVRLVLDAAPEHVIPASVSFVADVAQFTPKTVETALEREKLMFRVRANVPPELLKKYIQQVKTGLPGVAYVKLDTKAPWPAHLQVNLLQ
jgi:HlyD family secretion protein